MNLIKPVYKDDHQIMLVDHSMESDKEKTSSRLQNTNFDDEIKLDEIQETSIRLQDKNSDKITTLDEIQEMSVGLHDKNSEKLTTLDENQETSIGFQDKNSDKLTTLDEIPEISILLQTTNSETQIKTIEVPIRSNNIVDSEGDIEKCKSPLKMLKGKHKIGFNETWKDTYPWIKIIETNEKEALLCTLCMK